MKELQMAPMRIAKDKWPNESLPQGNILMEMKMNLSHLVKCVHESPKQ